MPKKRKKYSMVKVFGLPGLHENTSIKFIPTGISLSVGLNVTPDVAFTLTYNPAFEGKVFKGEKMQVYKLACKIAAHRVCDAYIISEQKRLLGMVQQDIALVKGALKYKRA